jgi:S-methylmethionine-dependent homocysteine/selenocysteine methylase
VLDTVLPFAPAAIAIMHSPLDAMLPAIERLGSQWQGPIGAYAEIPYPEDPEATVAARLAPEVYSEAAQTWVAAGARIIGGCCGTTPAHIAALAELF